MLSIKKSNIYVFFCLIGLYFFCQPNSIFNEIAASENNPYKLPQQVIEVGYNLKTFSTNFTSNTVDVKSTGTPNFYWYPWQFFGHYVGDIDRTVKFNGDGSITMLGDNNMFNASIATAVPTESSEKFLGTVFGGGAYFEAVLKFNSTGLDKQNWPAFWSMAIEHMASLSSAQWPRQANGYEHFIEADFFEYDVGSGPFYGGALHDWYGIWNKTCQEGYCVESLPYSIVKRQVPTNTDFNQYHRYGFLWVPATDKTSGYAEYYFDDKQVGERTSWVKYNNQPPPPKAQPWTFGIIDRNHLVLVLGTGLNQPMTVKSVKVWQASAKQNLSHTKRLKKNNLNNKKSK